MEKILSNIKPKRKLVKTPISLRPYEDDIDYLKKYAKKLGMKFHPFLVELLSAVVKENLKSTSKTKSK